MAASSPRHWQRTTLEAYGSASEQRSMTRAHPDGRQHPFLYTHAHKRTQKMHKLLYHSGFQSESCILPVGDSL